MPANSEDLSQFLRSAVEPASDLLNPLEVGNIRYPRAIDYVKEEQDETGKPPEGVFDSGMPGAMSLEDLQAETDLGKWTIQVGNQIAMLEV